MNKQAFRTLSVPVFAVLVGMSAGCATTKQIDDIRDMAQAAQDAASQAEQASTEAATTARDANSRADAAFLKAEEAALAAGEAQACCDANSEKIDRMFEKSMTK